MMELCRKEDHARHSDKLPDSQEKGRTKSSYHRRHCSDLSISSAPSSCGPETPRSCPDRLPPTPTAKCQRVSGAAQDDGTSWERGTNSPMDGDSEYEYYGESGEYYTGSQAGSSSDPRHLTSDGYCCLVPGCKAVPFKRNADLDRHYKHKHRPDERKDAYFCDYPKCSRRDTPFHRRDHFRDHLRDYHKEDIAKRGRPVHTHWVESRNVKKEWWRCTRCLSRVMVESDGFDCPGCNTSCDSNRVQPRTSP